MVTASDEVTNGELEKFNRVWIDGNGEKDVRRERISQDREESLSARIRLSL